MTLRLVSAAARAAGLLIFGLTLVVAESGTSISGENKAGPASLTCVRKGDVFDAKQLKCIPDPKAPAAPTGLRTDSQPTKPVCRPDQVLIGGKVCGCPAQTRAKMLSPGVFKCMPT